MNAFKNTPTGDANIYTFMETMRDSFEAYYSTKLVDDAGMLLGVFTYKEPFTSPPWINDALAKGPRLGIRGLGLSGL